MKKGKMKTADGSEFTVFYLKGEATKPLADYHDPDHPLNKHDEGQMYNMNEQDVNENSAGGGMHAAFAAEGGWPPTSGETLHNYYFAKSMGQKGEKGPEGLKGMPENKKEKFLDKLLAEISLQHQADSCLDEGVVIDDSLDSDVVHNPLPDELYKIKGLNKLSVFKGHSLVVGVHSVRWYSMDYHGFRFHVPEGCLLKTNGLEANKYFNK